MKLQLTGMRAILVVIAALGFMAWRATSAHSDLDAGAAEELTRWLRAEYARDQMRGIASVEDMTPARVDSLLDSQRVSIASVKARGAPGDMVLRIEILVDGRTPPDGRGVRYYRMSHSAITGWHLKRETSAWSFYTAIF